MKIPQFKLSDVMTQDGIGTSWFQICLEKIQNQENTVLVHVNTNGFTHKYLYTGTPEEILKAINEDLGLGKFIIP